MTNLANASYSLIMDHDNNNRGLSDIDLRG